MEKKYYDSFKRKHHRYDRIYYRSSEIWVDVFFENGKLSTAYVLNSEWRDILCKGDMSTFELVDIPKEELKR